MRLILVRHGAAYAGLTGVIGGRQGCAGLTPNGRMQAEALRDRLAAAGRLRPDAFLASELPRAIQTAEIIAPPLGFELPQRDCELCEVHVGEADGLDWEEYPHRYGSFDMQAEPDRPFAPGGDSWNSFNDRVRRVMARLATDHVDETVVAVCHAGVIMASVRTVFGLADEPAHARLAPSNTGMTVWEHDQDLDRWTLRTFNDDAHLAHVEV
jgi:probable phosphoglycerate mutase